MPWSEINDGTQLAKYTGFAVHTATGLPVAFSATPVTGDLSISESDATDLLLSVKTALDVSEEFGEVSLSRELQYATDQYVTEVE